MKEYLILVDENDTPIGKEEKQTVHIKGLLHRAFSIFIFNSKNELLLQQRSDQKYHSPSLWTNTCCSHPRFEEGLEDALKRRLTEEMGMSCELKFSFSFKYKVQFENGLFENEFDHVYIGHSDEIPVINPDEVKSFKYMSVKDLTNEVILNPSHYTEWLKIILHKF